MGDGGIYRPCFSHRRAEAEFSGRLSDDIFVADAYKGYAMRAIDSPR